MRETVTKCDECKKEIPETAPRIVIVLAVVKQDGIKPDPSSKRDVKRASIDSKSINDAISQEELCSPGCAFTFFKKKLGNGVEHDQQHHSA